MRLKSIYKHICATRFTVDIFNRDGDYIESFCVDYLGTKQEKNYRLFRVLMNSKSDIRLVYYDEADGQIHLSVTV